MTALAIALGFVDVVSCLMVWRQATRIGRLGRRVREQNERASTQALDLTEAHATIAQLRDENTRLLRLTVEGSPP
jgi:hypothetical protein